MPVRGEGRVLILKMEGFSKGLSCIKCYTQRSSPLEFQKFLTLLSGKDLEMSSVDVLDDSGKKS